MHLRLVVEREQAVFDALDELTLVAAPEVSAPDRLLKERVAAEDLRRRAKRACFKMKADAPRRVAGSVDDGELLLAERQLLLMLDILIDGRRRVVVDAEEL